MPIMAGGLYELSVYRAGRHNLLCAMFAVTAAQSPLPSSALNGLAQVRDYSSKRISSYDVTGNNVTQIHKGWRKYPAAE